MSHSVSRRVATARTVAATGVALALLALSATPAAGAPPPPTPYTGEAAELTTSSVTLKGSVFPGNQQTSYYFQYGTSTAYGGQTPLTPAGAGTGTIHVAASLTGLTVDSSYHYRLVAVNAAGATDGQDRIFTTKKIPLTFTLAATPSRDPFASPFSVTGTLAGTDSADHAIVLQANPFPYLGGFKNVGNPELTDADGSFAFEEPGFTQNTQLRVATLGTPQVDSDVVVELVAVRVTLHLRATARHGYARLYGTITPAERGALVSLQLLRSGHGPLVVGSALAGGDSGGSSHFSHVVRIRHAGLYRAYAYVLSGAQVSSHSRAILIG
jgi:hypothetical protein